VTKNVNSRPLEAREPRVALVAPGEYFGGAERQIAYLLSHLQSRGASVELLLLHDRELAASARALGITPQIIGTGRRFDLQAIRELVRSLRASRSDVVHAHGYKATVIAGLARMRTRFALVKTEHGRMESGRGSVRERLVAGSYRRLENALSRMSDATVVYVTRELQQFYAREHAGMQARVIYNGIASHGPDRSPRPVELTSEHFNIVVLGRLEHVKGVEHAIRAMAGEVPRNVQLHVVGDGPLQVSLRALADQLGVNGTVVFHGFRADGAHFAAHADLLLMPSLHEGLPYTLLEAIDAGTPVAASAVGGLAEVLEHERTALLFPPADAAAVAAAISRMHGDEELRKALAARASAVLLPRLRAETMGDAYLELYREVARERA
jgi:glycosyltransferase involved in cell wall biosynthesis